MPARRRTRSLNSDRRVAVRNGIPKLLRVGEGDAMHLRRIVSLIDRGYEKLVQTSVL